MASHHQLHASEELAILGHTSNDQASSNHEFSNAALITYEAYDHDPSLFPHYGLLGSVLRQTTKSGVDRVPVDPRLYFNTSTPWSAVICGVQGSGKSHTVSCLLEASLISDRRIGSQTEPLAGLIFHYDEENGGRPCEAAYLSAPSTSSPTSTAYIQNVTVLVSPSNLQTMRGVYHSLPHVKVHPLYFKEVHLNASRMLAMMGCDDIDALPLYMKKALSIVRELGADNFTYSGFKEKLNEAGSNFNDAQRAGVEIRTGLLDSYLDEYVPDVTAFFGKGDLVVVDLSDPFLASVDAALLFDIALGLFVDWKTRAGKIVVLDEAHKYLTNSATARLSRSLSSLVRQQRHLGIRLVIATQEPTVVPVTLVELCSFVICHKFSSPGWAGYLKGHVSIGEGVREGTWEEEVMQLRTGQALVFCSGALCLKVTESAPESPGTETKELGPLGMGCMLIRTRMRITMDGGRSIVAGRVLPSSARVQDETFTSAPITPPISESGGSSLPPSFAASVTRPITPASSVRASALGGPSQPFNGGASQPSTLASPIKLRGEHTGPRFPSSTAEDTTAQYSLQATQSSITSSVRTTYVDLPPISPPFQSPSSSLKSAGLRPFSYKPSVTTQANTPVFSTSSLPPSDKGKGKAAVDVFRATPGDGNSLRSFEPLVRVMHYYCGMGMEHPSRASVTWKLEREAPDAHSVANFASIEEFIDGAVARGVVKAGSDATWGPDWLQLSDSAKDNSTSSAPKVSAPIVSPLLSKVAMTSEPSVQVKVALPSTTASTSSSSTTQPVIAPAPVPSTVKPAPPTLASPVAPAARPASDFAALVRVLSACPQNKPQRSTINGLLMAEKPDYLRKAGFERWAEYAQAAQVAGVVELGSSEGGTWISLKNRPATSQAKATTSSTTTQIPPTSSPVTQLPSEMDRLFKPLVDALKPHGTSQILQYQIAAELKKKNPDYFIKAGFKRWGQYIDAAAAAGVVSTGGTKSDNPWVQAVVSQPTQSSSSSPASSPPTGATASSPPKAQPVVDSRFALLVKVLQEEPGDKPMRTLIALRLVKLQPTIFSSTSNGFSSWKELAAAAEQSGVVVLGGDNSYPWVALASRLRAATQKPVASSSTTSTSSNPALSAIAKKHFTQLVQVIRDQDSDRPLQSLVVYRMRSQHPAFLNHFPTWGALAVAAVAAGYVQVGGTSGQAWISCT